MVVTHAQSQIQAPEEGKNDSSGPNSWKELPFSEAKITFPGTVRARKTRTQHRQARLFGMAEREPQNTQTDDVWGEVPDNFEELQREDVTLKGEYDRVTNVEDVSSGVAPALSGEAYIVQEGLLNHQPGDGGAEQLVVPKHLRGKVLVVGHEIPWSGHLNNSKTYERIAARFYWPGLYSEVQEFCRSCPKC